jgi:hypothetical protein
MNRQGRIREFLTDLVGVISLFGGGYLLLIVAYAMGN